jgi:spoIIIJ-associated protein
MDIKQFIKDLFTQAGFDLVEVTVDENNRKISLVVDDEIFRLHIPEILQSTEYLLNLILKKENQLPYIVDMNYYRKERERIIIELAKAGAKKAKITKQEVVLPPMNSYERRLVHMEIASNPDLKTESVGIGKTRHVVIKPIES